MWKAQEFAQYFKCFFEKLCPLDHALQAANSTELRQNRSWMVGGLFEITLAAGEDFAK